MNLTEARTTWARLGPELAARGFIVPEATMLIPDGWKHNYNLAMDAQPATQTLANSAVPALLTTLIDPEVYRIVFSPNKAAEIATERKKGSWLDETAMFPVVE